MNYTQNDKIMSITEQTLIASIYCREKKNR
ncbi:MAG: hypothetical protein ACFWUE_02700 [Xylanivirga thermophila]